MLKEYGLKRGQICYEVSSKTGFNINNAVNAIVRAILDREKRVGLKKEDPSVVKLGEKKGKETQKSCCG